MVLGDFRERIIIQKNSIETDDIGNQKNIWIDYYRCFAYVNNLSGKEYWQAAQVNSETQIFFIVRYCSELKNINSTKYRIKFRSELYNITFVDFMQYKNRLLKLRADLVKR